MAADIDFSLGTVSLAWNSFTLYSSLPLVLDVLPCRVQVYGQLGQEGD